MEDKALYNPVIFTFAIICMILSIALISFTLYVFPHVLFDMQYDVPEFFYSLTIYYKEHHSMSGFLYVLAIFAPLLIGGIIFGYMAKLLTDFIDAKITVGTKKDTFLKKVTGQAMITATEEVDPMTGETTKERRKTIALQLIVKFTVLLLVALLLIYLAESYIVLHRPDAPNL